MPLGISIAASIRVGNELGAGNHVKAKRASAVSIGTSSKREREREGGCFLNGGFFLQLLLS